MQNGELAIKITFMRLPWRNVPGAVRFRGELVPLAGLRFGEEYSGNWAIEHKMMKRGFLATRFLTAQFCAFPAFFPRSENPDLRHPAK
jgi:hypothetical protein